MRANLRLLALLVPALAVVLVAAAPPTHSEGQHDLDFASPHAQALGRRDGDHDHGHNHHAAPLTMLNETEISTTHQPTPPSYWSIDIQDRTPTDKRYPGLMVVHVLFMGLAFFGALPIGIALRSVKHAWHGLSVILFYTFVVLGLSASGLYKKLTPNMYEGNKHGRQGYYILFFACALSALDLLALFGRAFNYAKAVRNKEETFAFKTLWNTVILGRVGLIGASSEYTNLVVDDPEEFDEAELKARELEHSSSGEGSGRPSAEVVFDEHSEHSDEHDDTAQWANDVHRHRRHHSYAMSAGSERTLFAGRGRSPRRDSDDTLHEMGSSLWAWLPRNRAAFFKKFGSVAFATAERALVFGGLMQVLTGVVDYTGGCRQNWLNGCLAHLIKGAIFWSYGLVSFARYLGAFSELGWAWNRSPKRNYPSAEFVECLVIFLYGASNTWMERFGAQPGDPFTTKQIQHISIAVMYWFAGLLGMGIESKTFRRWLAGGATAAMPKSVEALGQDAVAEPPSYIASFNPFPALCIGFTGIAMSAHFQTYLFQVQIHEVWGYLLSSFAFLRCITYFFLWLGPPRSILPSRPPTEALASFFLACGGLEFMFSTEELTIAAMRQGHDDVMMFLNVGVAITCLACCWVLSIVSFKGWLKSRTHGAVKFVGSA